MSTPITNLGQFLFYFKYLWAPGDFALLQTWLQNLVYSINQGAFGASVLAGLDVTPGAGLSVNLAAGWGVGDEGQLTINGSPGNVVLSAPITNPRWDLLVMRPKLVNDDSIPDPSNPSGNVFLHQLIEFDFVVITGTESATPVYPSKADGDVVLTGLKMTVGQVSVTSSNIDYSQRSLKRKSVHAVKKTTANDSIGLSDETIDADATGGVFTETLPSASLVFGQDYVITKVDSSANAVNVTGSDLIDGQGTVVLDTQWQSLKVRSVGTAWRVL